MNYEEMYEIFVCTLNSIMQVCDKTTNGNVSHNIATIKCKCRDMISFYKKYPINPWHSVEDGDLPQVNKDYVFSYNGFSYIGYMREDKSIHLNDDFSPMIDINEVDYWMEIPQIPKQNE